MTDHVAEILDAWARERPDLDVSPVGIFGRISRIERHKNRALAAVSKQHNIDGGDYDVLAALRRSGPPYCLTPTELFRGLIVTSATMTERLDRLERRELIRRHRSATDRRSVIVELTEAGRVLQDSVHEDLLQTEAGLLAPLSGQSRAALATLLAELAGALDAAGEITLSPRPAANRKGL
jgi:DNA-binding MarR family transcriptional regulator